MNKKYINHQIYTDPNFYNDIMWWKKDDIQFWKDIIKNTKSKKILELCCGTGRIGLPLIDSGIDYYGIDSSSSFIDYFHNKISKQKYDTSQIYKDLKLEQSVTSSQLGYLRKADLLNTHREGKKVYYSINRDNLSSLLEGIKKYFSKSK